MTTTEEPTTTTELTFIVDADLPKPPKISAATETQKEHIRGLSEVATLVPWSSIQIADDNIRDADRDIKELAEDLRAVGLLQPMAVSMHDNGRWVLVAGNRRYLALRALGFSGDDLVPVHPLDHTAEEPAWMRTRRMLSENMQRVGLTPIDEAMTIDRLSTRYGMTQAAIAEQFGWNKKTVAGRVHLLALSEDAREQVNSGALPIEAGQRIGRLISQGAPANLVKQCLAQPESYWVLDGAERKWKGIKAAETLQARLEARSVTVVASLRAAPASPNHEVFTKEVFVDLDTAAAVRELDVKKLVSVSLKDSDGKPVMYVESRHDGVAVAWTLGQQKKQPTQTTDHGAPKTWEVNRAAQAAQTEARRDWWKANPEAITPAKLDMILASQAARKHGSIEKLGKMLAWPVVYEPGNEDGAPSTDLTLEAWLTDATNVKVRQLLSAATVLNAVSYDGWEPFHEDDKFAPSVDYKILVELGMPPSLIGDDWQAALDAAEKAVTES